MDGGHTTGCKSSKDQDIVNQSTEDGWRELTISIKGYNCALLKLLWGTKKKFFSKKRLRSEK